MIVMHAGVEAIAAGRWHSMLLKSDNTVWSAGWNRDGQLGDGTNSNRNVFTMAKDITGQRRIMAYTDARLLSVTAYTDAHTIII